MVTLRDFIDVLVSMALSPLVLWLAGVGLIIALGCATRWLHVHQQPAQTSARRPVAGAPYDWKRDGL